MFTRKLPTNYFLGIFQLSKNNGTGNVQGCDRRRYYIIYVNVLKIDVIHVIFDFEDVICYFCQNETSFLSN